MSKASTQPVPATTPSQVVPAIVPTTPFILGQLAVALSLPTLAGSWLVGRQDFFWSGEYLTLGLFVLAGFFLAFGQGVRPRQAHTVSFAVSLVGWLGLFGLGVGVAEYGNAVSVGNFLLLPEQLALVVVSLAGALYLWWLYRSSRHGNLAVLLGWMLGSFQVIYLFYLVDRALLELPLDLLTL